MNRIASRAVTMAGAILGATAIAVVLGGAAASASPIPNPWNSVVHTVALPTPTPWVM